MKDIDLSFRKTSTGIGIKTDSGAIRQLMTDLLKTRYGEVLWNGIEGTLCLNYTQSSMNAFSVIGLRDEIYRAVNNNKLITVKKKNILIKLIPEQKKYFVQIKVTEKTSEISTDVNIVFNVTDNS